VEAYRSFASTSCSFDCRLILKESSVPIDWALPLRYRPAPPFVFLVGRWSALFLGSCLWGKWTSFVLRSVPTVSLKLPIFFFILNPLLFFVPILAGLPPAPSSWHFERTWRFFLYGAPLPKCLEVLFFLLGRSVMLFPSSLIQTGYPLPPPIHGASGAAAFLVEEEGPSRYFKKEALGGLGKYFLIFCVFERRDALRVCRSCGAILPSAATVYQLASLKGRAGFQHILDCQAGGGICSFRRNFPRIPSAEGTSLVIKVLVSMARACGAAFASLASRWSPQLFCGKGHRFFFGTFFGRDALAAMFLIMSLDAGSFSRPPSQTTHHTPKPCLFRSNPPPFPSLFSYAFPRNDFRKTTFLLYGMSEDFVSSGHFLSNRLFPLPAGQGSPERSILKVFFVSKLFPHSAAAASIFANPIRPTNPLCKAA